MPWCMFVIWLSGGPWVGYDRTWWSPGSETPGSGFILGEDGEPKGECTNCWWNCASAATTAAEPFLFRIVVMSMTRPNGGQGRRWKIVPW